MKILINASNLHGGGAAAIACSFIKYLSSIDDSIQKKFSILASSYVMKNISAENVELRGFRSVKIKDYYGPSAIINGIDFDIWGYDLVYTIMGPLYSIFSPKIHFCGFAHPWIIYRDNVLRKRMGIIKFFLMSMQLWVKAFFLSRANYLVVEHQHVKISLEKLNIFKSKDIFVVHSQVDPIFSMPDRWAPINFVHDDHNKKLGVISRDYPHKNLGILPEVKRLLKDNYGFGVDFYVTFTEEEWRSQTEFFRASIINVGPLLLSQCPKFYEFMDGVILPTFLECFSAVPIEAMFMRKPLFISNFDFISVICGKDCEYFNPEDANDIARVISNFFTNTSEADSKIKALKIEKNFNLVAKNFSGSLRGDAYLDLLSEVGGVDTTCS